MMRFILSAALLATAAPIGAIPPLPPPPPPKGPELAELVAPISADRLKRTVETLVGFGTRHTLSSQTHPKRGIGAAVRWAEREMKALGLETLQICETVTLPPRIPAPTKVCNAVAIQRGRERPGDVVIITGHIDSRVSDPMNALSDAPGANDDGSGTAAVIEAARALSSRKFPGTIVYAALSGEEQGLVGGRILADYAKAQGWNVIANLNNDIVGNSCGNDGTCNRDQVRVFSEGLRWQGGDELRAQVRSLGGENDSPSRNLSRYLDSLAGSVPGLDFDVMPVWRNDRFGRGGDHSEFLNAGFPAVRLSVGVEDYDHQHQDVRTEKGTKFGDTVDEMDFDYLAKVTKLDVAALASIASAPPPPEPKVEGAVSTDTIVSWKPVGAGFGYVVRSRPTDSGNWTQAHFIPPGSCLATAPSCSHVLKGVRVDDSIFGVASVSASMWESPVASAVPGGAFRPYVKPEETK